MKEWLKCMGITIMGIIALIIVITITILAMIGIFSIFELMATYTHWAVSAFILLFIIGTLFTKAIRSNGF